MRSETHVLVVGVHGGEEKILLHSSLRNAAHAHYIALPLPEELSGTRNEGQELLCYSNSFPSPLPLLNDPERKRSEELKVALL